MMSNYARVNILSFSGVAATVVAVETATTVIFAALGRSRTSLAADVESTTLTHGVVLLGLVESIRDGGSPTGKGCPRYRLAVDRERLFGALADDDCVAPAVERVDSDR